jgi:RNA polymerase sigma factor (sigma-70 family)
VDKDLHQLNPLLERSVAGDAQALNDLLGRLRPYLHALVRRKAGKEDNVKISHSSIVQDALLRISQHVGGLRQPTVPHLLNYAGKVIHNLIVDAFRQEGRGPRFIPWDEASLDVSAATATDHLEGDERAVQVAAALARLPEKQRQVVEWRFLDRLPDAEIANRLGCSAENVRILRYRALRTLGELMGKLRPDGSSFQEEVSQ